MSGATIDHSVWGDARFEHLGQLAGYSRYEAVGRMAHLWDWCTEQCSYAASRAVICRHLGPGGDEHILAADLGELRDDGTIRVKGTDGRIEWKSKLRESSRKGGEATRAKWEAKRMATTGPTGPLGSAADCPVPANGRPTEGQLASLHQANSGPDHRPNEGPPSPSPSPSPIQENTEREPSPSARGSGLSPAAVIPALALVPSEPPKPKRKAPLPADWAPKADHAAIAREHGRNLELEVASMRDWDAAVGKGSKNWDATFRNWLRRPSLGGGPRGSPPRDPRVGYSPARDDSHTTPDGIVRVITEF